MSIQADSSRELVDRRSTSPLRRYVFPLTLGALLVLLVVVLVRTAWVSDDAYITFRTVDNLVHGRGLRWNVDERVQTYTHPLWMLMLAVAYTFTGEPYFTSIALGMACSILTAALIMWRVAASPLQALLAGLALVGARSFVDFSTSGLENPLVHLLLVCFWLTWPRVRSDRSALPIVIGSCLLVTRLDLLGLVGPALAVVALGDKRPTWQAAFLAMTPLIAWEAFSILYYGFPVPNTAYAKLWTGIGRWDLARQGVAYLAESWRHDPITLAVIVSSAVLSMLSGTWRDRALGLGQILHLGYVVAVGGDFMSGRFLTPAFVMGVLQLAGRPMALHPAAAAVIGAAVLAGAFVPDVSNVLSHRSIRPPDTDDHGIVDERRYYFQTTGLIRKLESFKTPVTSQAELARTMVAAGQQVATRDQIGFFGYGAGPNLHVVDWLGLGDPLMARLPAQGPWRIGHFRRELPPGYIDTLRTGENVIRDPSLQAYYTELSLITRGPLLSAARLRAILGMNFGLYDRLLEAYWQSARRAE